MVSHNRSKIASRGVHSVGTLRFVTTPLRFEDTPFHPSFFFPEDQ